MSETTYYVSPTRSPIDLAVDTGTGNESEIAERRRTRRSGYALFATARRQVQRQEQAERVAKIKAGEWPSYAAAIRQPDGRWAACVMLNRRTGRYVRRLSVARWPDAESAYAAAETWCRDLEKPR